MEKIFMAGADVGDLEVEYVVDALKNGWYENKYYYVEKFEKEFAEYHGRKYALMTPNCTSSIHLILSALGVSSGDEVLVPECTWIASTVGIVHLGAKPIFCDIEKNSWCIDPESVEERITPRTKAIIAVNLFGNMSNWKKLNEISAKYNIPIIEDAAESLGSIYYGTRSGKMGIASCFSFHNTKTLTTGEGGMLLLDDQNLYNKCLKLRDLGRGPETLPYFNEIIGYKFMPFNIQAALGLAQFHRMEDLLKIKRHHFEYYRDRLSHLDVQMNFENDNIYNGAWITGLVVGESYKTDKKDLIDSLEKIGVPSRPFFYPLSSIPAYNSEEVYKQINPVSYKISSRGINLPGASNLNDDQLEFICSGIEKVLKSKENDKRN
jgi:perosamine synthetase